MPEICSFYGIRITINYNDHNPPHFHATYNDNEIAVSINDINVLKGVFPSKQLKLVLAWAELHQDELLKNWNLSKEHDQLIKIKPLQ